MKDLSGEGVGVGVGANTREALGSSPRREIGSTLRPYGETDRHTDEADIRGCMGTFLLKNTKYSKYTVISLHNDKFE